MAIYCHPWDSLTSEKPWNLELLDRSDLVFRYARLRGPHFTEPGCVVCSLIKFFPSFPRCSRLLGLWHRNPTDQQQRLGFAFILWIAIGVVKCHPSVSDSVLACMCVCVQTCVWFLGRGKRLETQESERALATGCGLGTSLARGVGAAMRRASSGQNSQYLLVFFHALLTQCSNTGGCVLNMAAEWKQRSLDPWILVGAPQPGISSLRISRVGHKILLC